MTGRGDDWRDPEQRIDQIHRMHADAVRPGGVRLLLRRVARFLRGQAALLDERGEVAEAFPETSTDFLSTVADEVIKIRNGRTSSATVRDGGRVVAAVPIGGSGDTPVLVVAAGEADLHDGRWLVSAAARLLWLCWQVEVARRGQERIDRADDAVREAVLHLLMRGERGSAHRVAAALGPPLPERFRISVIESPSSVRDALLGYLASVISDRTWIVRCPVYTGHLILLVPELAQGDLRQDADSLDVVLRDLVQDGGRVEAGAKISAGTSHVVSLREVPSGYEQAFHALACARRNPVRYATFNAREDLASVVGPTGRSWAARLLAPLIDYVPNRIQDPDAAELRGTLESWLSFHHRAATQLKIHRNTLAARLVRLESLLHCDAHDVRTQATLHLALRLLNKPPHQPSERTGASDLDALLASAAVRFWAERQLAPLLEEDPRLLATLRAWFKSNTRLEAIAAEIGISEPAARKRLIRVETTLERSVLKAPSARYDLYFALRIHRHLQDPE